MINQLKIIYNQSRFTCKVVKLLVEKMRLDENEIQSIQSLFNIEIYKYKRQSKPKNYVHEYQNYYLESLQKKNSLLYKKNQINTYKITQQKNYSHGAHN